MSFSHSDGRDAGFPALALAALLVVHTILVVWPFAAHSTAIDFFTFWSVPHTVAEARSADIYSPDGQRALASVLDNQARTAGASPAERNNTGVMHELYGDRIDVTGSPLLYTLVAGISSGMFETDTPRYMALVLGSLCVSLLLLCWILQLGAVPTLLMLALVASNFSPVISDVTVGNVNALQLLAVSAFVFAWTRNQPGLAGVAIGAGTIFKPTIALVIVLAAAGALARRDRRRTLTFAVGVAAAALVGVGVSAFYFGSLGIWGGFLRSLGTTLGAGAYTVENGNFGLSALLFATTGWTMAAVLFAVMTLTGVWLAVLPSRDPQAPVDLRRDAFFAAGWGCGIVLLSSPLAWLHYYVLLIPAILGAIGATTQAGVAPPMGSRAWLVAGFVPLALLSASVESLMGGNKWGEASLANLAGILTLTMLAAQMWSARRRVPAPAASAKDRRGQRSSRAARPV